MPLYLLLRAAVRSLLPLPLAPHGRSADQEDTDTSRRDASDSTGEGQTPQYCKRTTLHVECRYSTNRGEEVLTTDLDSVSAELLNSVCGEQWPESATLEFKKEAPGQSDRDKHELLKDVAALANTDGGDLIYGVEEADGLAQALAPITSEAADSLERRIGQVLEAGLEPRILGIRMRRVDVGGGYVLVLRVPASFQGPHCIKVNTSRRFVMRNGTTTSDLTFDQLRMAFDRTASLAQQARAFITNRTESLVARKSPKRLKNGPVRALHFVPISSLAGRQRIDLQALNRDLYTRLVEIDWGGGSRVFNLDGLVVYPGGDPTDGHYGYAQVFRNGAFEAASLGGGLFRQQHSNTERLLIWSLDMTKWFRERSSTILSLAKSAGLSGPAVVCFSMLHVENYALGVDGFTPRRGTSGADRAQMIAPEVWIDSLETANVDDFVRPLLDTLWQGFAFDRCLDYNAESGKYQPRRE